MQSVPLSNENDRLHRMLLAYVRQEFEAPVRAILGYAEIMIEDAVHSDALSALINLGYQRSSAEKAITAALNEGGEITVESILRRSLRRLAKP